MKKLVAEIASRIRNNIIDAITGSPTSELRRVFNGPPLLLLRPIFECLIEGEGGIEVTLPSGDRMIVPVLLQIDRRGQNTGNPPIGSSGLCDENYLLALRNSPACPHFVVLLPPGNQRSLSVASATDEFGLAGSNNAGNSSIADWWNDPFIQDLADGALSRTIWAKETEKNGARKLLEGAVLAADEIDRHGIDRESSWLALARVWEIADATHFRTEWTLACGYPPVEDGSIDSADQIRLLEDLSDEIEHDGFAPAFAHFAAAADERVVPALEACRQYLQQVCDVPTAFKRATPFYYGPFKAATLAHPPQWWEVLTVEVWSELLRDEKTTEGSLSISCANSLIPPCRGINGIVADAAEISIELPEGDTSVTAARVSRDSGSRVNKHAWEVMLPDDKEIVDSDMPIHRSPIRYTVEADGYKKANLKVVSLATFEPGVFIYCRTAKKIDAPRRAKSRDSVDLICNITLVGQGRHYIDIHKRPGVTISHKVVGKIDNGVLEEEVYSQVATVSPSLAGFEIDATAECYYDVEVVEGDVPRTLRLHVTCDDTTAIGAKSEFERLIRLNTLRAGARATTDVQIDRQVRSADLQAWILSAERIRRSFKPLVIAEDYAKAWKPPEWLTAQDTIFSSARFLHDPRPVFDDIQPPHTFVEARAAIAAIIRGEDENGLIEAARLGERLADQRDETFAELVDQYVRSYNAWLESSPDVAIWSDLIAVCEIESDGKTLRQEPDALIMTPLHPIRLAWHCIAQREMYLATVKYLPCPAASILDPGSIVDSLALPLRTATGSTKKQVFFSTECTSDYWGVLWNGAKLERQNKRGVVPPFDKEFGLQVGGLSAGFSAGQVRKALNDVANIFAAKPVLNVFVTGDGNSQACNDGLLSWARDRYVPSDDNDEELRIGSRIIQIFDDRHEGGRPDDAEISNLSEDANNRVRWFSRLPSGTKPDLGILAQLDTSNASAEEIEVGSALSFGALFRHRIRRQLDAGSGAFLSESRSAVPRPPSGDGLADKIVNAIVRIENQAQQRYGYTFAPNVHVVDTLLSHHNTDFAAVSSAAVDPACFLGGWLSGSYLWDYDLPSYSSRSGDSNGYYLLSKVKETDVDAMRSAISRLPTNADLSDDQLKDILLEVARRGIPTVRGLSRGDSGAAGDVGVFVAARLLQDNFRLRRDENSRSMLSVWTVSENAQVINLIVPFDPFRAFLDGLFSATQRPDNLRPDLLVLGFAISDSVVKCKITPMEVKYRGTQTLSTADCNLALRQTQSLAKFLRALHSNTGPDEPVLWRIAFQHLLSTIVGYGFRVYSQQPFVQKRGAEWSQLHQRAAEAILGDQCVIEIDQVGRLIVVDGTSRSAPRDVDGDGFSETIVLSPLDAAAVISDYPTELYRSINESVGDWQLTPDAADVGHRKTADGPNQPAAEKPLAASAGEVDRVNNESEMGVYSTDGPQGVVISIGATIDGFRSAEVSINISDTNLNQLNIGVVGDLGTGKTQLLKSLVYQIAKAAPRNRGISPRVLIFDYKDDYGDEVFATAVRAKVVTPSRLPINLFDVSHIAGTVAPWLDRFKFFADVLEKIFPGIGPVQRAQLKAAVKAAYDDAGSVGRQPTIYDVQSKYREMLGTRADAPSAIIDDIVDMQLFDENPREGSGFDNFLDGVVVIKLSALGQDDRTKNMLVAIMLNMYYEHMLRIPKRPFEGTNPQLRVIDSFLLVDEADNIMRYEFDVLRKLLLQGREFGVGVVLASQYLRHFKAGGTDYREPLLTWFIHKVPNVNPQELSALGLTGEIGQLSERIKTLPKHECLVKSLGFGGEFVAGMPFYRLFEE